MVGADGNQQLRSVWIDSGRQETLGHIEDDGVNHPFNISPTGDLLITGNSQPISNEIWWIGTAAEN